jgi:gliding motility-associated-like protein
LRIVVTLLLCLLGTAGIMGQNPVANFSASTTSGCAPLIVTFTDQSTGSPKFWNWDFGNGALSNLQNPTMVFSTPGVYTVTLVVRNNNGADGITKTNYITVNPSPSASFIADKQIACNPSNIQFTDASVPNAGTIVQWQWTFGDGGTSTLQNPTHQYTATGFYDVGLTVTSSTGCKGSNSGGRFIRIVPGVKADFTFLEPATCKAPFNINFSNQTSGPGNLTYSWDFGNSTTSTLANPAALYAAAGMYTVRLSAQSDFGCQDNIQKNITVAGTTTSFSGPDSICLNTAASFQNTSSPTPVSSLWKFGDGTQSTVNNPSKTYITAGTFPITLYSNFGKCLDSLTKQIKVVTRPTVDFTAPKKTSCKAPLTVNFQDISPDAVSWQWNFGDGGTSTQKNPAHTYNSAGYFDVTLTITDSKGCQNTYTQTSFVQIVAPVINVTDLPAGGCAPYSFSPSPSAATVDGVAGWLWNFGEAGATSTASNPTYVYNNTGTYTLSVTITTTDGCTATTTIPNAVKVGTPVATAFTKSSPTDCFSSPVSFTNTSAPPGDAWLWYFGDGDSSILQNPVHRYKDTGNFNVTLIAYNNGCPDTLTQVAFVHVQPPVADFDYTVDCAANKLAVNFINLSKTDVAYGPISYEWQFGDPANGTATSLNASFVYPAYGDYTVKLITRNGVCTDTSTQLIRLRNLSADFTAGKAVLCRNEFVTFTPIDPVVDIINYQWFINGGPNVSGNPVFSTNFSATGTYSITLRITDINGCVITHTNNNIVTVTGPTVDFNIVNGGGCKNTVIQFNDVSTSTGTITQWTWDFGDTQTSAAQHPTHSYSDTGVYNVQLTVRDNLGCSDSFTKQAHITKPTAWFGADTTRFCPGGQFRFKDSSYRSIVAWNWNFGDGNTSTQQNPIHVYSGNDSVYTVKLVVTDMYGCTDSVTRTNYVTIIKPKPAFGVKDSTSICPPLETKFTVGGTDYESYFWDFGDGGSSLLPNPSHFFNTYGSFTVKLYVLGYGGCLDSASSVVNVYNPNATTSLSYTPITACNELTVDFNITITPSTFAYLYFGDGTVDSSQQKTLQHFYKTPSFYSPLIILVDSGGCQVGVGGPTTIRILGSEPIFAMDRKNFCDSGSVFFTNFAIGNDPVVSQSWDFGDGNTTATKDASHFYSQPGTYYPSLTVNTQAGCSKTLYDTVRVYNTPHPFITSNNLVCDNTNISFMGNLLVPDTSVRWKWDFGNGKTDSIQAPATSYNPSGNYTVHLTATNLLGCRDTTSKAISVKPLPSVTVSGDTSFIVGSGITIPLTYSSNVTAYNWTPGTNLSCTNCPNPYANPKFTTTYNVAVTDSNGCVSSRNVTLISLCNDKNFFIPNTFSPNADGVNDNFFPRGTGIFRLEGMRIFNRWGELVFEKKNFQANQENEGWNGLYKGKPAEVDTYVYFVDIVCENGVVITYKGNVTLIR